MNTKTMRVLAKSAVAVTVPGTAVLARAPAGSAALVTRTAAVPATGAASPHPGVDQGSYSLYFRLDRLERRETDEQQRCFFQ